jgi:hypothetical protein
VKEGKKLGVAFMLQEFDKETGCPVIVSTRNKKQRIFLENSRKKKKATGLQHKAKRLQKNPEHARKFKEIKSLLKKSAKLTPQTYFI